MDSVQSVRNTKEKTMLFSRFYRTYCINKYFVSVRIQESYGTEWIYENVKDVISEFQFGSQPGAPTVQALIFLMHKWHFTLHTPGKAIRIVILDFRTVFDLVDHSKFSLDLYEYRYPARVGRMVFSSYLYGRLQGTSFQGEQSDLRRIESGVPQGSKLGPISLILQINFIFHKLPHLMIKNGNAMHLKSRYSDVR